MHRISTSAATSATNTTTNEGSCKLHITRIRNTIFAFTDSNNVKISGSVRLGFKGSKILSINADCVYATGLTFFVMDANQPVWIDGKDLSNEPESSPIEFRKSVYQCGDKMIADAYPYDEMIIKSAGKIEHCDDFFIWDKAYKVEIVYFRELNPSKLKRKHQALERAKEKHIKKYS